MIDLGQVFILLIGDKLGQDHYGFFVDLLLIR